MSDCIASRVGEGSIPYVYFCTVILKAVMNGMSIDNIIEFVYEQRITYGLEKVFAATTSQRDAKSREEFIAGALELDINWD